MNITESIGIARIKGQTIKKEEDILIVEYPFTIYINEEEIITLLCTPKDLKQLAIGFLFSEGFIDDMENILDMKIDEDKGLIYIDIKNRKRLAEKLQGKRTITSGCGKGTMFYNVLDSFKSKKIREALEIHIEDIKTLVRDFNHKSELFLSTGGVHSSALCTKDNIIFFAEDIGRHNALDKILGNAIMEGIDFSDKLVITSGRISSEMLIKVAKRGIPLVISRSAPTNLSVELARELNIGLVGFARGEKMNIYSNFSSFKI